MNSLFRSRTKLYTTLRTPSRGPLLYRHITTTEDKPRFSKDESTKLRDEVTVCLPRISFLKIYPVTKEISETNIPKQPENTIETEKAKARKRASAESDDELRRKLEEISGEGGISGIEMEDGKPASMKRAVRNNMFRYI
jgi:hypothetical protein